ncbi:hypothetical protein IT570_00685 [Candidatus Sumerlaeota bacterium]|nr:hypothetical protein [Candidatus Sumerlaeota bacterium]
MALAEALFTGTLPDTLKVYVDYYNRADQDALKVSAAKEYLDKIQIPGQIEVPTDEVLVYSQFLKRKQGAPGYLSFAEILEKKAKHTLFDWDGLIEIEEGALRVIAPRGTDRGTSERLGEAIGLALISKIHRLTSVDWSPIEERKTKTLDYSYSLAASSGEFIIEVENKGTSCADNRKKDRGSVYSHASDIRKKKKANPAPANGVRYGTIVALDGRKGTRPKCWLLDPPLTEDTNPEDFRLLARLENLRDLISFISPRSPFSASLQTRVSALQELSDPFQLDSVGLLRGDGEGFDIRGASGGLAWFANKSHTDDDSAGGQVFALSKEACLFIGINGGLLPMLAKQDFDPIASFIMKRRRVFQKVRCVVPNGRFQKEFKKNVNPSFRRTERGGYTHFTLQGHLFYTTGGLVFGFLPLDQEYFA